MRFPTGIDKAPTFPLSPPKGPSKRLLRSSSAVSGSKNVQLSPIGSQPRFFQRRTHEASTFPLSPSKGWLENSTSQFCESQ